LKKTFFWEIGEKSRFVADIDIADCVSGHDSDGITQTGIVVMTNSEPGIEQDKALIGEIIDCFCY